MKPADREAWLLGQLEFHYTLDVLNRDLVDDYINATGSAFRPTNYGAHKCAQLGRDLTRMARKRRLSRSRTGIEGMGGMGFPRWVWTYRLPRPTGWEIGPSGDVALGLGASTPDTSTGNDTEEGR